MKTHGIAVFDVCGTITRTNNTFEFVRFVLGRDRLLRYGLLILIRLLSPLASVLRINSVLGKDLLRDWQIALLRGYRPDRIEEMAHAYVEELFAKGRLRESILQAIQEEKEQGRTVYLVSAAIGPPIAALAERLGIDHCFCSELNVQDGRFTGKLRTDLLGRKESILRSLPAGVDLEHSSAYSDDVKDAGFLNRFGQRMVVLKAESERRQWSDKGQFRYLLEDSGAPSQRDVDSVNFETVGWIYVPSLYYIISRFHRAGLRTLFFRELVPVILVGLLFARLGAFAFVLIPLSFLAFYSIYEVGGLINDLHARSVESANDTRRISRDVPIRVGLFLAIRVVAVGLILACLSLRPHTLWIFIGALGTCLGLYATHSLAAARLKIVSFTLLKVCRTSIPLIVLADYLPAVTVLSLCAIFFAMDAPWRVYNYSIRHGLARERIAVWHLRFALVTILCGAGAVIYLVGGPPYLLVIASYYVALDGFWVLCGR